MIAVDHCWNRKTWILVSVMPNVEISNAGFVDHFPIKRVLSDSLSTFLCHKAIPFRVNWPIAAPAGRVPTSGDFDV